MGRLFGRSLRTGIADVLDSAFGASALQNRLRGALAGARYDQMQTAGRYNEARAEGVEAANANLAQLLANVKERGHKFNMVDAVLAGPNHMNDAVKANRGIGAENRLVKELQRLESLKTDKATDYRSGSILGSNFGQIGAGRLSETKADILRENEDALTAALDQVEALGINPNTKEGQSLLVEIMARGKPVSGADVKNVLTTESAIGVNEAKIAKFNAQAKNYKTLSDIKKAMTNAKITDLGERRRIEEEWKAGKLKVLQDTATSKDEYWKGKNRIAQGAVLDEKDYKNQVANIMSLDQQSKDQFRKAKSKIQDFTAKSQDTDRKARTKIFGTTQASLAGKYDSATALNDQKKLVEGAKITRINMARDLDAGKLDKVIADIENNEKKLGAQIKEIEQNITSDKIKDRTEIERRKKILAQIKTERVMQDKHRATISLIKAKVGKISAQIEKLRKEGAKLDWEMLGLSKTSGDSLLNNFTKLYSTFMKENEIAKVVMRVDENGIEKVDYENSIYFNDLDPEARAAYVEKQLLTSWMKRSSAMREALPKILGAVQAEEGGAPQSPVSDVLGGGVPSADDFKPPGLFGQQMNQDDTSANPVANQLSQVQGQQTNVPVSNVANQKLVDRLTSYTTTAEGIEKLKTFLKQAQAENNVDMVNHITQIMRQANINP